MKNSLRIEEFLMFLSSIYLFNLLDYEWWLFLALFLAPDLSMLGYIISPKIGAYAYNLFHHKGVALAIYLLGIYTGVNELQLVGLILFGHSSFDRIMGYGLKYEDSFNHTHLGLIGKAKK